MKLEGKRTVEDALAHAETWRDSQEAKGERYVELLYDDTVKMINNLVLLAEEVRRLDKEVNARCNQILRLQVEK